MAQYDDRRDNVFLALWTLAVLAATLAFLFYLSVRVRTIELGYELGKAHQELGRLREIERVLELEASAHEGPERVGRIANTLLGMKEPRPEHMRRAGRTPTSESQVAPDGVAEAEAP